MWNMENLNPAAVSWIVTSILLLGGMLYEIFFKDGFGLLSIFFFMSQMVYWTTRLYVHYKQKQQD
jgi:hypothetical protein